MSNEQNDLPRSIRLTDDELKKIVRATVHETFITLGVNADEPLDMQKDFQHLRDWRQTTDAVKRKSIVTAIVAFIAAVLSLAWVAFQRGG